jgi:hypothetical protein
VREPVTAACIQQVLEALAGAAREPGRVYLTGGATAIIFGWRNSTIDIDLKFVPEHDAVLRAIPEIKERLRVNLKLASPADFIPVPDGWEERSRFVAQVGLLAVYHFDLYAQALAKVERGHRQDLADVREMISRGLVDPVRALEYLTLIEPQLYRFPAVHRPALRQAARDVFGWA